MLTPNSWLCLGSRERLGRVLLLCVISAIHFLLPKQVYAQTLSQALDATNLTWTTGGSANWFPQTSVAYDAISAAKSGVAGDGQESWLQTTVVGPGTVSFWWKVSSQPVGDFLQFFVGTNLQQQISGAVDWQYQQFSVPTGTNVLKWRYIKNANLFGDLDTGWLDQVIYRTNAPLPLQQTLKTCGVAWSSGGNNNPTFWNDETNVTHSGGVAAQSGAIYHLQESWMEATVSGATNVSFWWKVSSEEGYDFLEFQTNGIVAAAISGEMGWTNQSFSLPSGTNTLRWRYLKDDGVTVGADRGWVDQVVFGPSRPAFPYVITSERRLSGQRFYFAVTGEVGCACSVLASTNLINWEVYSNFVTTNAITKLVDSSASNFVTRYFRAVSP